ncbi:acyl--CoA ligase [Nocardia nova]|uniref:class I adenylate-forming enzyme family protein n=1 Tax=Nocardia nova TaxID=37330 RepID=UPI001C47A824|nr:class I adenylate-forming enzyme family protein [Nocardia nova]MBV7708162.1 acyl--CoA ligase [Nocardia nova]
MSSTRSLTYQEVAARVDRLADRLRDSGHPAVALVAHDPVDSIVFLLASCQAGVEGCLYPADRDITFHLECAAAFDHALVGIDDDHELVTVGQSSPGGPWTRAEIPDEPMIAVLTSGTTGKPKATRHHWRSLVASAAQGSSVTPNSPERWLLAYNLNQYAGLQVLAHVLNVGATVIVPDSIRPGDGVEALVTHRVTHVSATPTFWRVALGVLERRGYARVDLTQITVGGEAVSDALLHSLKQRFPRSRISHIYATSEIGSSVSVTDGKAGLPTRILYRDSGHPVQFRIENGQLLARSAIGMIGYHDSVVGPDDWVQTGDLVEVRDDRIRFVGRVGSVINVGGVKVHPLAVEDIIGEVEGVAMVHVYGRANAVTGNIVAVEVVARDGWSEDVVRREIETASKSLPAAHRPRIVKFVESLSTIQNKIDRRKS